MSLSSIVCREHLNSDMRDKELSYWTCRGVQVAGYFVATIDDEVVGTISYLKEKDHLEIHRLSTDRRHRQAGVAASLVDKVERGAAVLKCKYILAVTSSGQEPALAFYRRNSWTEVSRLIFEWF